MGRGETTEPASQVGPWFLDLRNFGFRSVQEFSPDVQSGEIWSGKRGQKQKRRRIRNVEKKM